MNNEGNVSHVRYVFRYIKFTLRRIKLNWRNRIWQYKLRVYLLALASISLAALGFWFWSIIVAICLGYYLWRYC